MKKRGYRLTRRAAVTLRDIHARSLKQWGEKTADKYIDELYAVMAKATAKPEIGRLRARRAVPFLMVPAGQHFIVYDYMGNDIVILAFLHQRRDIEHIITAMAPAFGRDSAFATKRNVGSYQTSWTRE